MLNFAAVFIGGGIGAVLRYFTGMLFAHINILNFPLSTFMVNIAGSFLIGFLGVFFISKPNLQPALRLMLTLGFCGGLTTFSTFSAENINMLNSGKYIACLLYVFLSVSFCFLAAALGAYFANRI